MKSPVQPPQQQKTDSLFPEQVNDSRWTKKNRRKSGIVILVVTIFGIGVALTLNKTNSDSLSNWSPTMIMPGSPQTVCDLLKPEVT
ncbi:hypothetical protein V1527DRAFT_455937, partial [Lipomyces starkeyi]